MRLIRNVMFLIIGILIGVSITLAHADTQQNVGFGLASVGFATTFVLATAGIVSIASTGGLALGALGLALLISNDGSSISSKAAAPIVIQLDPATPLTTPEGWSSPTSPPATVPIATYWGWSGGGSAAATYPSAISACIGLWPTSTTVDSTLTGGTYRCRNSAGTQTGSVLDFVKCPTGYNASGSTCNVATPTAVIKPIMGQQSIKRTGNTFAIDPQINHADINPAVTVSSNQVQVKGKDGSVSTTTINSDGTAINVYSSPTTNNNTQITTTIYGAPTGNGAPVTGISTQVVQGQGSQQTTTPATGTTIDVSSLNKESTQQAIKDSLNVTGTTTTKGLPNQPDSYYQSDYPNGLQGVWDDFRAQVNTTPFISLLNQMNPNFSGGTCPVWSMDFTPLGFGVIQFADLCYIFLIIKGIMILTALFTARAIIFGG